MDTLGMSGLSGETLRLPAESLIQPTPDAVFAGSDAADLDPVASPVASRGSVVETSGRSAEQGAAADLSWAWAGCLALLYRLEPPRRPESKERLTSLRENHLQANGSPPDSSSETNRQEINAPGIPLLNLGRVDQAGIRLMDSDRWAKCGVSDGHPLGWHDTGGDTDPRGDGVLL